MAALALKECKMLNSWKKNNFEFLQKSKKKKKSRIKTQFILKFFFQSPTAEPCFFFPNLGAWPSFGCYFDKVPPT